MRCLVEKVYFRSPVSGLAKEIGATGSRRSARQSLASLQASEQRWLFDKPTKESRVKKSSTFLVTSLALSLSFAATGARAGDPAPAMVDVKATAETAPVGNAGDAADDPAIWVNPADPAKSLVIGTNKQRGLNVYDLAGKELQFLPDGRMNNVDLRDGFPLGGRKVTLVTAGNRAGNTIAIYALDPATRTLTNVAARPIQTASAYGACMYRSAKTGKFYYILANKVGTVEQWELFDDGKGKVDARLVRSLKVGTQLEGCAADDELGQLYVGEEWVGVWKYGAEPDAGDARSSVLGASAAGPLVPDVEGIAIAATGPGTGFVIVSSQGNNSFVVLRREGANALVRVFRVVDGGIDGVAETDGLEVTTAPLGSAFPKGLLVVQDGHNDTGNQNFKLVPLQAVLQGI
jgi:3-phytase